MRLIDADELRRGLCAECTLYPDKCLKEDCDWDSIYHIDHAPTIEAEPKHGRWINIGFMACKCSVCDEPVYENGRTAYCPNCGAIMDLDEVEE